MLLIDLFIQYIFLKKKRNCLLHWETPLLSELSSLESTVSIAEPLELRLIM